MESVKDFLERFLMAILVTQGICLVLIIGVAVFFRYVMGAALSWPEEVAQIILSGTPCWGLWCWWVRIHISPLILWKKALRRWSVA